MLTWTHKKKGDRGLGGYVIDKCISITYDFLQARKKTRLQYYGRPTPEGNPERQVLQSSVLGYRRSGR